MVFNYNEQAEEKLKELYSNRPLNKPAAGGDNLLLFWNAGKELGVYPPLMAEYNRFGAGMGKCAPERVLPAPVRKPGETSMEWLKVSSIPSIIFVRLFSDLHHYSDGVVRTSSMYLRSFACLPARSLEANILGAKFGQLNFQGTSSVLFVHAPS